MVQLATPGDQLLDEAPFVAVDAVGAGQGELVLLSEGSAGRYTSLTRDAPVDAVILAILDSLEVGGETTFYKS